MKKIILFGLILLLVLPLSAYIDEKEGWKVADTTSPANQYAFNVVFNGAEYSEIGFSKTMTTYSKGMGLTKNEYTNKSLTLTQTAHDSSSYTYSTKDSNGNNVNGGYIYWYMSVSQAMKLYLKVESSIPDQNSVTVAFDTYSYSWVTSAGSYQYVAGTTSLSGTKSSDKTEITSSTSVPTSTDYGTVVVSIPACYAVVQGNSEFSVDAVVKEYPESRRIGTLKLTLVAS